MTRDDVPAGASRPLDSPHHVLLTAAVGGRLPGPPDAGTPRSATPSVDWVRAHAPA